MVNTKHHNTPQPRTMETENDKGRTVTDTSRRLAASPWPIYLCRLPQCWLPRGLHYVPPTKSVSTSFQHWPAIVYDDPEDLLRILPAEDKDVVRRHQQQENISHPESQRTKVCAHLLFWGINGERRLSVGGSSLKNMMNDGSNDIIEIEHIDDWIASADSLIENGSKVGAEVWDHAHQFKWAVGDISNQKEKRKPPPDGCDSETNSVEGVDGKNSVRSLIRPPASSSKMSNQKGKRRPPKKRMVPRSVTIRIRQRAHTNV